MEVFKYNDVLGGIIERRPNGLVDVDFAGTILTLHESENEFKSIEPPVDAPEFKTGGEIKSDKDVYENGNLQIRYLGNDVAYYKRLNNEWKFLSSDELQKLHEGTKHEMEHKSTIEVFKRNNVPTPIIASFIAWDHISETPDYYSKLDKAIPEPEKKFDDGGMTGDVQPNPEPNPEEEKMLIQSKIKEELNSVDFHKKMIVVFASELESLNEEREAVVEKYRHLKYPENQDRYKKTDEIDKKIIPLTKVIEYAKNCLKCLENKGTLRSFTDMKGVSHNLISDWRDVPTDNIMFNEETILVDPVPVFIPIFDETLLKRRAFIMDAIRLSPDTYIVSTDAYDSKETPQFYSKFVLVTLDQLVLISDYYFKKVKAKLKAEAENKTLKQEQYYDSLPEATRERHFNQANFYFSLPANVKKKITKEDWEKLDLAGKEKVYKPFKRYGSERITSSLEADKMYNSFHNMYERFINPNAVVQVEKGQRYADPEVWAYWKTFREMMDFKIKDIQSQRAYLNEAYATAVETSFGESNTSTILQENYGVLVKRQNGDKINSIEITQIETALIKVYSAYGNCRRIALKDNIKVSHTGNRLVFGTKAVGIYHPTMHTISSSMKYGDRQFQMTMAHEFAHFIDNFIGMSNGKMYASGEYESIAGKIAFTFRNNMNKPKSQQSDYINSTQECFARALEQYFTLEELGEDAGLSFSYKELKKVTPISNGDDFVSLEKFDTLIRPLIVEFFETYKDIFDKTIDVSVPEKPLEIEEQDLKEVEPEPIQSIEPSTNEIDELPNAIKGLEAYLPYAPESEKMEVVDAIKGLKASLKLMSEFPSTSPVSTLDKTFESEVANLKNVSDKELSDQLRQSNKSLKHYEEEYASNMVDYYKQFIAEIKAEQLRRKKSSPVPKGERNYLKEAKDFFMEAGFIEDLNSDPKHYVVELINAMDKPFRTKSEKEAEQYFIEMGFIEDLSTDQRFYVEKLIENSKAKKSTDQPVKADISNEVKYFSLNDDQGRRFLMIVGDKSKINLPKEGEEQFDQLGFWTSPQLGFNRLMTTYFKDEELMKKNINSKYHNQIEFIKEVSEMTKSSPVPPVEEKKKQIDGEPSDPAYLMTLDEYQQKVTPLMKEYRKWQKKNEKWFLPTNYNGLLIVDLQEVIDRLNAGKEYGHFYIHKGESYSEKKSPEQQARYWFSYYKTRNFDDNFSIEATPQNILDEKRNFMEKFSQFFTEKEIESSVEKDELNSPKRSIRRAIDNGTYKRLLEAKAVTLEQLEKVTGSVGVRIPKSVFSKSTQNQMDYEKKLGELMRNLPKQSVDQMKNMIDKILEYSEPLSVEIYTLEFERYSKIIKQVYEEKRMTLDDLMMKLPMAQDVLTYSISRERPLGSREAIVFVENIQIKPDWQLKLANHVKEYVEYLKYKMILAFMSNFDKITMPIISITMLDLSLKNGAFSGDFRFTFENGSSFNFTFRSVKAGGFNIQVLHYRYISDFADVKLADGSKGGTSLYEIIKNFSKK